MHLESNDTRKHNNMSTHHSNELNSANEHSRCLFNRRLFERNCGNVTSEPQHGSAGPADSKRLLGVPEGANIWRRLGRFPMLTGTEQSLARPGLRLTAFLHLADAAAGTRVSSTIMIQVLVLSIRGLCYISMDSGPLAYPGLFSSSPPAGPSPGLFSSKMLYLSVGQVRPLRWKICLLSCAWFDNIN